MLSFSLLNNTRNRKKNILAKTKHTRPINMVVGGGGGWVAFPELHKKE